MIKAVRHTGIVVNDLNLMTNFYKKLGFKDYLKNIEEGEFIDQVTGLDQVSLEYTKLKSPDGFILELLKYHSHPQDKQIQTSLSNNLGCSHVAYTVEDINYAIEKIINSGGSICNSPATTYDGKHKVAYCYDPEGVIMEIVEEVHEI
jgi:catechol 2,3-dioxygenase-like lactoylglutathione lyase family enzyme